MSSKATAEGNEKIRDADRSREAILRAAEDLFAERGFDGVSLGEIAADAGLSRGAPSYFFGSKAELYRGVLEGVFSEREEAASQACQPLVAWASSEDRTPIQRPLTEAVEGYLDFLLRRPSFVMLIQREELAGASHLKGVRRESKAIKEAFAAVRAVAGKRGLKSFEVDDAVLVFVSLTFFPLAQRSTFMASLGRDLSNAKDRRSHVRLVVGQLLHLVNQPKQQLTKTIKSARDIYGQNWTDNS
jgi:AcrR family transcriptional regulator